MMTSMEKLNNAYRNIKQNNEEGCGQKKKGKPWMKEGALFIGLPLCLAAAFMLSLMVGRYMIAPPDSVRYLLEAVAGAADDSIGYSVVMNIRMPRTLMALLVGAGLSVTGSAYQGMFQNPLVSPDVLGTSAGAAFGAVLGIMLSGMDYRAMALSVAFGLVSVLLAFALSKLNGATSTISLVLSGMIVQALMNAFISLAKYVADPTEKLPEITYWLMGSFSSANYSKLKIVAIPILLGVLIIYLLRWRLNILSLGDEECTALGVNPVRVRTAVILASTVVTAACVMAAGVIGWIGLVIPHISRMIAGTDHKRLIPVSFFVGGAFMMLVDILARSLTGAEIPISIFTALIGAPFFAVLFRRRGKG